MPAQIIAKDEKEEKIILEYKAIDREFKAIKYSDNSILITQTNGKNKNTLKMNSKGEVKLTTNNSKYFGLGNEKNVSTFTITEFDGEFINIKKDCVDSNDINKCIDTLEKYINSNQFIGENYLAKFGDALVEDNIYDLDMEYVQSLTKQQYNETYSDYLYDLEENNYKLKTGNTLILAPALTLVGGMSHSYLGTATAMTASSGGTAAGAALIILAVAVLYEAGLYISDSQVLSLDDIVSKDFDFSIDKDKNYEFSKLDGAVWVSIDNCMDTIENNSNDNNPNNDYYKARIFGDNNVYIDLTKAMPIDEAAQILKDFEIHSSNIYAYKAYDASEVIIRAGGIPGLSKKGNKFQNLAECHAFSGSYNAFDPVNLIFDLSKLKLKENIAPGIYYWHFHFSGKKLNNNYIPAHVFFGAPVIITHNDANKYKNGTNPSNLSYLDNYDRLYNDYEKLKTLVKKK